MKKKEIRKHYKSLRRDFSIDEVNILSKKIFQNLKKIDFSEDKNFHVFLPIRKNNEIDTYPIIDWLFSEHKNIIFPMVVGDDMINCKVEKDFETKLNYYQIPEPINYKEVDSKIIDAVLVPMFVADKRGNRVGYGGGYYDRFLARCKPTAKKIGLSYFRPIDCIEDSYFGDFPLDFCITPEGIESF